MAPASGEIRSIAAGHYLTEFSDAAIEVFLTRGIAESDGVDWNRVAAGAFQAYGGALGEVSNEDSAFSHRDALVEFFGGQTWADPAEDAERMHRLVSRPARRAESAGPARGRE